MKANDYCLSLEQAKELQKLGIEFTEASMEFTHYDTDGADEWYLTMVDDYADSEFADIEHILTLTCTEMMGMLPKEIDDESITVRIYEDKWVIEYNNHLVIPSFCEFLLRDALFDMIKYLKTNKLM